MNSLDWLATFAVQPGQARQRHPGEVRRGQFRQVPVMDDGPAAGGAAQGHAGEGCPLPRPASCRTGVDTLPPQGGQDFLAGQVVTEGAAPGAGMPQLAEGRQGIGGIAAEAPGLGKGAHLRILIRVAGHLADDVQGRAAHAQDSLPQRMRALCHAGHDIRSSGDY